MYAVESLYFIDSQDKCMLAEEIVESIYELKGLVEAIKYIKYSDKDIYLRNRINYRFDMLANNIKKSFIEYERKNKNPTKTKEQ